MLFTQRCVVFLWSHVSNSSQLSASCTAEFGPDVWDANAVPTHGVFLVLPLQLLLVLLLAMPEALSGEATVDLPVLSALLSLPFYLLCLLLASVHVLVCTSAESSCYFCSLSWGLVFAAVALSSAMFCILISMAMRRLPLGPLIHGKVSLCR